MCRPYIVVLFYGQRKWKEEVRPLSDIEELAEEDGLNDELDAVTEEVL